MHHGESPESRETLGADGRGNYSLEPHRRSEPEPAVTLWPEVHAESVERHFLPAFGLYSGPEKSTDCVTDDRADNGPLDGSIRRRPASPVPPRIPEQTVEKVSGYARLRFFIARRARRPDDRR